LVVWGCVGLAIAVPATVYVTCATNGGPAGRSAHRPGLPTRPDLIVINTDDQRWDTLSAMPEVRRLLGAHGITFTNSFVTTSFCCPSRASLFTGQYSRHTGVYQDNPPDGGAPAFDDRSTIATWLRAAGYDTALVGKYLNDYAMAHGPTYVPPGWQTFDAVESEPIARFYNYTLNQDGRLVHYGAEPKDYSMTVTGNLATAFVRSAREPFFLYAAPIAPHDPATPAPGATLPPAPSSQRPSFNEPDVSDKPWNGSMPKMDAPSIDRVIALERRQLASLQPIDRWIGGLVRALEQRGQLDRTVIVFTSDNGLMWGEHRLHGKIWPYEESIRVPLVIRVPWISSAVTDAHLVLNIDLAWTLAQLAGVRPGLAQDGRSLVPLLLREQAHPRWRTSFVAEYLGSGRNPAGPPDFEAIRTTRYLYVEYANGWRELYDLQVDPYALTNESGSTAARDLQTRLSAQLTALLATPPIVAASPGS
jgi:N-acetylglucosamine-6-sulfatase